MGRRGSGLDVVLLLGHHGKGGLLGVAVGLAGLHDIGAFTQLCLPGAGAYVAVLKPDVGLVGHCDVHITEMVGHVAHVDIHEHRL